MCLKSTFDAFTWHLIDEHSIADARNSRKSNKVKILRTVKIIKIKATKQTKRTRRKKIDALSEACEAVLKFDADASVTDVIPNTHERKTPAKSCYFETLRKKQKPTKAVSRRRLFRCLKL